ncbi:MAG: asparagine--tRNA ligase [Pseudanabaenaceae cyanobacterium bins.68]|nr:asparagine--tRNA ligase [Pseudanabaenaceae cyanobacterium bins.68]
MKFSINQVLHQAQPGEQIVVQGWVRTKRQSKEVTFLELNDGSCLASLQIVIPHSLAVNHGLLTTGAAIKAEGAIAASLGKGQRIELLATALEVIGTADPETYPLQKKRHSFEFLRTIAHLRPRTNAFGAVFRVRNACAYAIHQFFQSQGFIWVHTPIISTSDCEGAGEMFHVTSLKPGQMPDYSQDFFGKPAYLTVSGQLEAEVLAMAFSKVYTFGPTFRAENSNTSRHLAEFWMVEPEIAFAELEDDADLAEAFLKYLFNYVLTNCQADLEFFQERISDRVISNAENIINQPFERLTYTQAIEILTKSSQKFEFPVAWGIDLQSEHERYLAEQYFQKPVIVMDYPAGIKAFYMRLNDQDPEHPTVRAMDVLAPGIGEIIGGSQREERLEVLEMRLQAIGLNPADYWWYLDLRRYGTVPHAGFGLGFERLVQFMTGMANIRDVIPFPRTPLNADF